MSLDPAVRAALSDIAEKMRAKAKRSSIAIVSIADEAFEDTGRIIAVTSTQLVTQWGTGTLFRVGSKHFLITAAHVLAAAENAQAALSIWVDNPRCFAYLNGEARTAGSRAVDLGVIELSNDLAQSLDSDRFLTVADVAFSRPQQGAYMLFGYPSMELRSSPDGLSWHQTAFSQLTGLHEGNLAGLSFDSSPHVLLSMDGTTVFVADPDETPVLPPRLNGVSGASIWQLYLGARLPRRWTTANAKVVAVQTHVYPERRLAQGSRWAAVAMILWQVPGCRTDLESGLPPELVAACRA